jgi:hypothetical protein
MNNQEWYSNAVEVLSPLRWHLNELVEVMESYNRFAERMNYPLLPKNKIEEAKEANNKADEFFTR